MADLDEANPETKKFTSAYMRVCAPKARSFGDLDIPDSKVNQLIALKGGVRLKEETGNKTKAYRLSGGRSPWRRATARASPEFWECPRSPKCGLIRLQQKLVTRHPFYRIGNPIARGLDQ